MLSVIKGRQVDSCHGHVHQSAVISTLRVYRVQTLQSVKKAAIVSDPAAHTHYCRFQNIQQIPVKAGVVLAGGQGRASGLLHEDWGVLCIPHASRTHHVCLTCVHVMYLVFLCTRQTASVPRSSTAWMGTLLDGSRARNIMVTRHSSQALAVASEMKLFRVLPYQIKVQSTKFSPKDRKYAKTPATSILSVMTLIQIQSE